MALSTAVFCLFIFSFSVSSGEWCCGDPNTKAQSNLKPVTRTRVISYPKTEYHSSTVGYEPCKNNTVSEDQVPKIGLDHNSPNTPENQEKLAKLGSAWWKLFNDGKLGGDQYHSYCPIVKTKSRQTIAYKLESYQSAMFDDSTATCPDHKRICCKGYKRVGDTCISEGAAQKASDNLDFLSDLGIVG